MPMTLRLSGWAAAMLIALTCAVAPALASAQGAVAGRMTPSRELDQETLGGRGLAKCQAFKRVRRHSDQLQAADHDHLTPGDTRRLMSELSAAKRMAPRHLAPADCGVPL